MLFITNPHRPLEVSAYPPILANGATEAYEQFDLVFTEAERNRLAALAQSLAHIAQPDIHDEDILVSCFAGAYGPQDMDAIDQAKLSVKSSVPNGGFLELGKIYDLGFEGDDSNQVNVIERDRQALREERAMISEELRIAYEEGILTESMQRKAREDISAINAQIQQLGEDQATNQLPVYFATPLDGLRLKNAEDNPLAYSGELPGRANMALYDGAAIRQDRRLQLSNKSDEQVRITGRGQDLMKHALAVVQLMFTETNER